MAFVKKSAGLLKLLNSDHSLFVRHILGGALWLVSLIITISPTIAAGVRNQVVIRKDIKSAVRQMSWFLKRAYPNFVIDPDDYFNFCTNWPNEKLAAIDEFIKKHHHKTDKIIMGLDELKILAQKIHNMPLWKGADFEKLISQFTAKADAIRALANDAPYSTRENNKRKLKEGGGFAFKEGFQAFNDFSRLFSAHSNGWFVISGTFLGLVREKGFIPNDLDIDLGVLDDAIPFDEFSSLVAQSSEFRVVAIEYQDYLSNHGSRAFKTTVPVFAKIIHKTGINIDLFWHFTDELDIWHGTSTLRWTNSKFELERFPFLGSDVLGPKRSDVYLSETYGIWRLPVEAYNYHVDMQNLAGAPNFLGYEYELRRWIIENAGRVEHMPEIIQESTAHTVEAWCGN